MIQRRPAPSRLQGKHRAPLGTALVLLGMFLTLMPASLRGDILLLVGRKASATGGCLVAWSHEDTRWETPTLTHANGQIHLSLTPPFHLLQMAPDRIALLTPVHTRLGLGLLPPQANLNALLEAALSPGSLPDGIRKVASRLRQFPGLAGWTLVTANSEQIWVMHLLGEGAWAARRVPDDHLTLLTETLSIGALGPEGETLLSSGDLEARAIQREWFAPSRQAQGGTSPLHLGLRAEPIPLDSPLLHQLLSRWREVQRNDLFHLARAYSPPAIWRSPLQRNRKNRLLQLLGLGRPLSSEFSLPFSVPTRGPLDTATLISTLRDYQPEHRQGGGAEQAPESVLSLQTRFSLVFEGQGGRDWPAPLKARLWLAPHRPDLGPFTPWLLPLPRPPYGWETPEQEHLRRKTLERMLQHPGLMAKRLLKERLRRWSQFEEDLRKHLEKQMRDWLYAWHREPLLTQQIMANSAASFLLRAWFLQTEWIRDIPPGEVEAVSRPQRQRR